MTIPSISEIDWYWWVIGLSVVFFLSYNFASGGTWYVYQDFRDAQLRTKFFRFDKW